MSPPPEPVDEDPEFAAYFQELLDIPWDENLAMDDELECENPACVPNAQHYLNKDPVDKEDQQDHHEPISHNDALEQLLRIQKSNL